MTPETAAKRLIRLRASQLGCVLWSNPTGACTSPRPMRFGLSEGSADLIGIAPGGRFLAVEVKSATGTLSHLQRLFLALVADYGGIAIVARTPDGFAAALGAAEDAADRDVYTEPRDAPGTVVATDSDTFRLRATRRSKRGTGDGGGVPDRAPLSRTRPR